jgi:immune inhibitor A
MHTRHLHLGWLFGVALMAILLAPMGVSPVVQAAPPAHAKDSHGKSDDLRHPLGDRQRALRQRALQDKLRGKAVGKVHQVAAGQYVELAREGEDSIWTVLGEFGPQVNPSYGGTPGPLHNQIAEPDRNVDNATIWTPDFNRQHYLDLLFSETPGDLSMRSFYIEQSANRYTVNGDVTDWAVVPFNAANYGSNYCGDIVCTRTWLFVQDSVNSWYNAQLAAGKTAAEIDAYLAAYDVWDRYDHDGDGNFDEADGYIDHFQSVHAGEGEETGGGAQGTDAIWSHRWYAFYTLIGLDGPTLDDGTVVPFGGLQVGGSKYWIGDYTIEPENGGVGVFAHEFAHDLDLPDLYDTSGNTGGAENSTGFWTLMSFGSYGSDGTVDLGSKPTHMGAWEKFQLGWLNYEVAFAGSRSQHRLGPSTANTKQAQALFVVLPDKPVIRNLGAPYSGANFYYSGSGDNLDHLMYKAVTLPAGATLSAQVRYEIEADWDYAYVVVSTNNGASWSSVPTNRSTNTNPNGQNFGNGITGSSGGNWVPLTADLSAYSGPVLLGLRYWTDVAVVEPGFSIDDLSIAGGAIDGAESDGGWSFDPAGGFRVTNGSETQLYFNAYVAEFRQYRGYDDALRTGPYNFGFLNNPALFNYVEHFPYQDGLLVSYWDSSYADNNVGDHPGGGLILPVDAHPRLLYKANGSPWRPRIQSYDSTFSLEPTDGLTLHDNSQPTSHPSLPGEATFDDTKDWYVEPGEQPGADGTAGVRVPNTGTAIQIRSVNAQGGFMQLLVRPAR